MRWIAFVMLVGCQQILGIEEGVLVGPVGHDEDADTIDDGLDNCPATENLSQAANEPNIGTICDPHPDDDGDRIALFVSFFPPGPPTTLDSADVEYASDIALVSNTELRTQRKFAATVVSVDLQYGTFNNPESYFEVSVGSRACRIQACGSRFCLFAIDENTMNSMTFTPSAIDATLALVQTDTVLGCVLPSGGQAVATLPETTTAEGLVRVRANQSMMGVKNLTIFDVH